LALLTLPVIGLITLTHADEKSSGTSDADSKDPHVNYIPKPIRGLANVPILKDNPLTAAKIELGRQLFFDRRLSRDDTVSCSTCHDPTKGWSNGTAVATNVKGQKDGHSAPTIINAYYQHFQF
jgi:cytochrome c peroxidase